MYLFMKIRLNSNAFCMLILASFLLTACKGKDGEPGPKGETGAAGTNGGINKDSVVSIVSGLSNANGGFFFPDTDHSITFTIAGNRSDNVAYSYAKQMVGGKIKVDESAAKFNSEGNLGVYFFIENSEDYFYLEFDSINPTAVNTSKIGVLAYDFSILQKVDATTVHGLEDSDLRSNPSFDFSLSNLSYNASTRILTGNFSIPTRYEVTQPTNSGSTTSISNASFSIKIPSIRVIDRRGNLSEE
jgi:hypothetical protein